MRKRHVASRLTLRPRWARPAGSRNASRSCATSRSSASSNSYSILPRTTKPRWPSGTTLPARPRLRTRQSPTADRPALRRGRESREPRPPRRASRTPQPQDAASRPCSTVSSRRTNRRLRRDWQRCDQARRIHASRQAASRPIGAVLLGHGVQGAGLCQVPMSRSRERGGQRPHVPRRGRSRWVSCRSSVRSPWLPRRRTCSLILNPDAVSRMSYGRSIRPRGRPSASETARRGGHAQPRGGGTAPTSPGTVTSAGQSDRRTRLTSLVSRSKAARHCRARQRTRVQAFASYSPVSTQTCGLLWIPVDFSGRTQRSRKPQHGRVWASDSAQTRLESGGGGIRTLDPPNDG